MFTQIFTPKYLNLLNLQKCRHYTLVLWEVGETNKYQYQNVQKVTHLKGRLLDQAIILFICIPFQNGNFSQRKELAPGGSEFFPLRAVSYGMENHFYHIRWPLLNVTIFIMHVHNCVMGATPMNTILSRSEFFPLRAVSYGMENHFYHIRWPPLNVTIFICTCLTV